MLCRGLIPDAGTHSVLPKSTKWILAINVFLNCKLDKLDCSPLVLSCQIQTNYLCKTGIEISAKVNSYLGHWYDKFEGPYNFISAKFAFLAYFMYIKDQVWEWVERTLQETGKKGLKNIKFAGIHENSHCKKK